jgi:hypothetical protein
MGFECLAHIFNLCALELYAQGRGYFTINRSPNAHRTWRFGETNARTRPPPSHLRKAGAAPLFLKDRRLSVRFWE